jgi:hypothetical protein
MMNWIEATRSPTGSGGRWHRDSLRRPQYKAFVYLADMSHESQGPFCYLSRSNRLVVRLLSVLVWLLRRRLDYDHPDWLVRALRVLGVVRRPVLAAAGMPFFVNTSLLHRGLPITSGDRIAATVYLMREHDHVPDVFVDAGTGERAR